MIDSYHKICRELPTTVEQESDFLKFINCNEIQKLHFMNYYLEAYQTSDLKFKEKLEEVKDDFDKEILRRGKNPPSVHLKNCSYRKIIKAVQKRYENYKNKLHQDINVKILPGNSFYLKIKFSLETPLISRDDNLFYITENPMKKEWVTQIPMLAAASWKGLLHWVGMQKLFEFLNRENSFTEEEKNKVIELRLQLLQFFGTEQDKVRNYLDLFFENLEIKDRYINRLKKLYPNYEIKDTDFNLSGNLKFYPSYFSRISYDVINPVDGKTLTGTKPIIIEMVPADTKSCFQMIYISFDTDINHQLNLILELISSLFFKYGIGAKRSSGYGLIKKANGEVIFNNGNKKSIVMTDEKSLQLEADNND